MFVFSDSSCIFVFIEHLCRCACMDFVQFFIQVLFLSQSLLESWSAGGYHKACLWNRWAGGHHRIPIGSVNPRHFWLVCFLGFVVLFCGYHVGKHVLDLYSIR